jgi:hypothetical protein
MRWMPGPRLLLLYQTYRNTIVYAFQTGKVRVKLLTCSMGGSMKIIEVVCTIFEHLYSICVCMTALSLRRENTGKMFSMFDNGHVRSLKIHSYFSKEKFQVWLGFEPAAYGSTVSSTKYQRLARWAKSPFLKRISGQWHPSVIPEHTYIRTSLQTMLPKQSLNTCLEPAYNNLCGSQVESDEARRHLYFHWSVNISEKPYLQRPLFQISILKYKFLYLCYRMFRHY